MSQTTTKPEKSGLRIPGFAQLQRLGKSLMLPIAVLPAAGILLRLGQDDLLGKIDAPVIGPFFEAMSAAGGALFANLPLLFAVGVAIGFAKKADGSTALAAVVGYLVMRGRVQDHVADRARRGGRQGRRPGPDQLQRASPESSSGCSPRGCSTGTTRSSCRPTSASSAAGGSSRSRSRWPACCWRSR